MSLEEPLRTLYYFSDSGRLKTIVQYANSTITNYIRRFDPSVASDSKLYHAEKCLHSAIENNRIIERKLFNLKHSATDMTERCTAASLRGDFRDYDCIKGIFTDDAEEVLIQAETSVASVLVHVAIMIEHLEKLTIKMHSCNNQFWPWLSSINTKKKKQFWDSLKSCYNDDVPSNKWEAINTDPIWWLKDLRNARVHQLQFYVTMAEPPLDVHYCSGFNLAVSRKDYEYAFTGTDLDTSIDHFFRFLNWWCRKSEEYIKNESQAQDSSGVS